jgi:hypothetical protein
MVREGNGRFWNPSCSAGRPTTLMHRTLSTPIPLVLALILAGCARPLAGSPSPDATTQPSRPVVTAPDLPTVPPSSEPVTGEVPPDVMADLIADAVDRTGVEPEAIEVVQAAAVTWNDGSLGCPEPDMTYTMALVDGYHVILSAADEDLDYRVAAQGGFRLCETGGRPGG